MASDYIREFLDATKHLKAAADELRKTSGGKPIGQSLADAAKAMVMTPAGARDAAGRRTISEMYGFDPKQYRDDTTHGPPKQAAPQTGIVDKFRNDQHDMIRRLVQQNREPASIKGRSDPRKMITKPAVIYRKLREGAKGALEKARGTWIGRQGARLASTRLGRGAGKVAARVGAAAFSRVGITAGGAAAAGGAVATGAVVVSVLAVVATALTLFGKAVVAAADKQLEAMRQYEKVSAGMALVFAQADLRDTLRNMERGERLAPSAQRLSDADQKLKDNSSEIIILVERIQNNLLAFIEGELADVLSIVNDAAKAINEAFGGSNDKQKFESFDVFLDRVAADAQKAMAAGDRWHAARNR